VSGRGKGGGMDGWREGCRAGQGKRDQRHGLQANIYLSVLLVNMRHGLSYDHICGVL
jgi:hypothetical protein